MLWKLQKVGDAYMLINKATGDALDSGGQGDRELYMHEHPSSSKPYQQWHVNFPSLTPPDTWQHPLPGYRITSPYGWRTHPITGKRKFHGGTDFGTGNSNPTIVSAKAGKVVRARYGSGETCSGGGTNLGYGNLVIIDHGGGVLTRYAHLDSISVTEGSQVLSGTPIGTVGTTGCSTGNHLHFEVRINGNSHNAWSGQHTDPMQYI